jgi:hypothetical protein
LIPDVREVGGDVFGLSHLHPALDAAQQGRALVVEEVVARARAQQTQQLSERVLVSVRRRLFGGRELNALGVTRERDYLPRHLGDGQDEVHRLCLDGGARHRVVLSFRKALRERDAAPLLDAADAQRAVGARPREDDGDGPLPVRVGERAEEEVDGGRAPHAPLPLGEPYLPVRHVEVAVGGDDVDVVRLDPHGLPHLRHRHPGLRLEHFGQMARALPRQVQDDDEGHPRVGGHTLEELPEGLDAARRSADADEHQLFAIVTVHHHTPTSRDAPRTLYPGCLNRR